MSCEAVRTPSPLSSLFAEKSMTTKGLRIATIAMTILALIIVASVGAWSFGPTAARTLSDQIGGMAAAYTNAQLERDFETVYSQYRARLPIRVDDRMLLVDLSYRGHVFRLRHLVEPERAKTALAVGEQARKTMLEKACADGDMRTTMKRGAIYEYQYLDRQSRLLGSFDIRNADCEVAAG
jgi:hypothetical protein